MGQNRTRIIIRILLSPAKTRPSPVKLEADIAQNSGYCLVVQLFVTFFALTLLQLIEAKPHQDRPNHTRLHQTRSDHTRPNQVRPSHTRPGQLLIF